MKASVKMPCYKFLILVLWDTGKQADPHKNWWGIYHYHSPKSRFEPACILGRRVCPIISVQFIPSPEG
jgi:hypothetical protein